MNTAIEFAKIIGVDKVRHIISECGLSCFSAYLEGDSWANPSTILVSDLKQIVDAWDLVEAYGGLSEAKWDLDDPKIDASEALDLKQAINLVEQCNDR